MTNIKVSRSKADNAGIICGTRQRSRTYRNKLKDCICRENPWKPTNAPLTGTEAALCHLLLEVVPPPFSLPSDVAAPSVQASAAELFNTCLERRNARLAVKVAGCYALGLSEEGGRVFLWIPSLLSMDSQAAPEWKSPGCPFLALSGDSWRHGWREEGGCRCLVDVLSMAISSPYSNSPARNIPLHASGEKLLT